jgi:hypothetical protein
MTPSYSTDIIIFGGGIAGLWLLNRLHNEGYQAILFETGALGGGQTIASQGIIHGGLKYALSGSLGGAADAIADMPARWRACINGEGDVNIGGCNLLCDHFLMWSESSFRSRLKTFLGSKSLRGRIASITADDYPDIFQQQKRGGSLYRLPDFVVDTPSLLKVLSEPHQNSIFKIDPASAIFDRNEQGDIIGIQIKSAKSTISVQSQKILLCAGSGNQQLLSAAKIETIQMQSRPLNMVALKKRDLPLIYAHCIADNFSLTPKLTITSHRNKDGNHIWYLGGELAESGVGRNKEDQLMAGKSILSELFPTLDLSDAQWDSFVVNRTEVKIADISRPDKAFHAEEKNVITTWPTKLTLTPSLADNVIKHLASQSLLPGKYANSNSLVNFLDTPEIAKPYWENHSL